jgi:hypothetical protein
MLWIIAYPQVASHRNFRGAYQALDDQGLRVPADVSVVSFDDDPIASWLKLQLTTLAIPHYELGRRAIDVLFGNGDRPQAPGEPALYRVPMPFASAHPWAASKPTRYRGRPVVNRDRPVNHGTVPAREAARAGLWGCRAGGARGGDPGRDAPAGLRLSCRARWRR